MAARSWSSRRTFKVNLVRLVLCLLGASFALALRRAPSTLVDRSTLPDASQQIADSLGYLDFMVAIPPIRGFLANYPQLAIALAGALFVGIPLSLLLAHRIHGLFLASFNDDVLVPVTSQFTVDQSAASRTFVSLPWCLGEGSRQTAWAHLQRWAHNGSGRKAERWLRRPKFKSMTTAALVGRSGSGKSRMAGEFARDLSRQDLASEGVTAKRILQAASAYLRRTIWFLPRRLTDPWDCGVLRQEIGKESFDQYVGRLKSWRPRRPTLLILDDPALNQTARTHRALAEASADFKHPVRFLVVNQTITADSLYVYADGQWLYDGAAADPPPIVLPEEAWFSDREVRDLAFRSGVLDDKSEAVKTMARNHLHRVTRGNPLLVELALEWLVERGDFEGISVDSLRRQRIDRVIAALQAAGVTSLSQFGQLAIATLTGGADRKRIASEAFREGLFGVVEELPPPAALRACFPADPLTSGAAPRTVPAIRPDLIADAFVDHVLEDIGVDEADGLLRVALRIDPAAMLRQIERPRPLSSPLGPAFRRLGQARVDGVDAVEWALAHARLAAFVSLDDWTDWSSALQEDREIRASEAIAVLGASQRHEFARRMIGGLSSSPEDAAARQVQPHLVLRFVNEACGDAEVMMDAKEWISFLRKLRIQSQSWSRNSLGPVDGLTRAAKAVADDFELADSLAETIYHLGQHWRRTLLDAEALSPTAPGDQAQARRLRMAATAAAESFNRASYAQCIARLDELVGRHGGNRDMALEAVRARRHSAYAWAQHHDPEIRSATTSAAAIEARDAAAARPDDPKISLEAILARTFRATASATGDGRSRAVELGLIANEIEGMAAAFPSDPDVQLAAAAARNLEVRAWHNLPAGEGARETESAAAKVLEITQAFPGNAILQLEAAQAFSDATFAWNQVPEGNGAAEARRTADVAVRVASAFPGDNVLMAVAAKARRFEGFAWAQEPTGAFADEAASAALAVVQIARFFPANPEIQWQVAMAKGYEAAALSRIPLGAAAGRLRPIVLEVAEIAKRFPDYTDILREVAHAYRCQARAWAHVPAGAEAKRALKAAAAALRLCDSESADVLMHEHAVEALASAALAYSNVPEGTRANKVRNIANEALAIARRFPLSQGIQLEAANARRFEVQAWSAVPDGAEAGEAEAAAARVDEIAKAFLEDVRIQKERAIAWRYAALAWALGDTGAGAEKVTMAADRVAPIAVKFRGENTIQACAADARQLEAFVWSRFPGPVARIRARLAAEKLHEVASPSYSGFPELAGFWSEARKHVEAAEARWPSE